MLSLHDTYAITATQCCRPAARSAPFRARPRKRGDSSTRPPAAVIALANLLEALIRQPGRVFSRSELIDSALGGDSLVLERTIDVHIRALRQKLGPHAILVETVRGVGYRFRDPAGVV